MGTNGEAAHMTSEERSDVIRGVRAALDKAGLEKTYLLVGTGGQSARETIKLSKEAKEAGADYACVVSLSSRPPLISACQLTTLLLVPLALLVSSSRPGTLRSSWARTARPSSSSSPRSPMRLLCRSCP